MSFIIAPLFYARPIHLGRNTLAREMAFFVAPRADVLEDRLPREAFAPGTASGSITDALPDTIEQDRTVVHSS